jgi:dTMP kinase
MEDNFLNLRDTLELMFFLAFEGLDGSGKSTLMGHLQTYLSNKSQSFIETREPGGTELCNKIRDLILMKGAEVPNPRTELLLYEASRAQHVDAIIKPALALKQWVLCDRFAASSVAFQAGGRFISEEQVNWLNSFATDGLQPHLYVLLDLTVQESKQRRQKRTAEVGVDEDRMESEESSFHERVRQGYLKQSMRSPQQWLVLNASESPEKLFSQLMMELKRRQWLD